MSKQTMQFGLQGERVAERFLRAKGWKILQRRYRSGHRDIDLIAQRENLVAFVEVKARVGAEFGDPVEAVNWKKRNELVRSAVTWIDRHGRPGEVYRFDVVGVLVSGGLGPGGSPGERVRVRHVENAFLVQGSA